MDLYHYTPRYNVAAILRRGLLPSAAFGRLPRVWMCVGSRRDWARRHVAAHHGVPLDWMVCLRVTVPRHWLKGGSNGVYTCDRPIGGVAVTERAAG